MLGPNGLGPATRYSPRNSGSEPMATLRDDDDAQLQAALAASHQAHVQQQAQAEDDCLSVCLDLAPPFCGP